MRLLHQITCAVFAALFVSAVASAALFKVPAECDRRLAVVRGPQAQGRPVKWGPFVNHLRALGYSDQWIPTLLEDAEFDEHVTLHMIRDAMEREDWSWGEAMTTRASARLLFENGAPLEYLAAIPSFDAAAAVMAHLEDLDDDAEPELLKHYAQRAPFWARGRSGQAAIFKLFEMVEDSYEYPLTMAWMLRLLPESKRLELHRLIAAQLNRSRSIERGLGLQGYLFTFTHVYPAEKLPTPDGLSFGTNWLRLDRYPPLKTNAVRTASYGVTRAGDCKVMTLGHLRVILGLPQERDPDDFKQALQIWEGRDVDQTPPGPPTLIRLAGRLVGVIKSGGEDSMLALRNVVHEDGRVMLMMGGVYQISPAFLYDTHPLDAVTGWPFADVTELSVKPLSVLMNGHVWEEPTLTSALKMIGMCSDQIRRDVSLEHARVGNSKLEDARQRLHPVVWAHILWLIDDFRRHVDPE